MPEHGGAGGEGGVSQAGSGQNQPKSVTTPPLTALAPGLLLQRRAFCRTCECAGKPPEGDERKSRGGSGERTPELLSKHYSDYLESPTSEVERSEGDPEEGEGKPTTGTHTHPLWCYLNYLKSPLVTLFIIIFILFYFFPEEAKGGGEAAPASPPAAAAEAEEEKGDGARAIAFPPNPAGSGVHDLRRPPQIWRLPAFVGTGAPATAETEVKR